MAALNFQCSTTIHENHENILLLENFQLYVHLHAGALVPCLGIQNRCINYTWFTLSYMSIHDMSMHVNELESCCAPEEVT